MRLLATLCVLCLAAGCAAPEPPSGVWAAWTLPAGDGWQVWWKGEGRVTVDGQPVAATSPLSLSGDRAHTMTVGDRQFTVPARPARCEPLRFIVLGDGRATVNGVGPGAYWPGILGEAMALEPAFVLNLGDLVKNGDVPREWPPYLKTLPPWPPIMSVRGNHDRGPLFYDHGLAPGEVFGHAMGPVFVAGFDTSIPDARLDAAFAELDRVLATADTPWILLYLHRPVWSLGNHGSDERRYNDRLVPIIDRHGVDVVFAGHDHHYGRMCPSMGLGAERHCVAPEKGTTYFTAGGVPTFTNPVPGVSRKVDPAVKATDTAHSRFFSGAKHFVEVVVDGDAMTLTAHRTRTGNVRPPAVMDRFVIPRRRPTGCP